MQENTLRKFNIETLYIKSVTTPEETKMIVLRTTLKPICFTLYLDNLMMFLPLIVSAISCHLGAQINTMNFMIFYVKHKIP